MPEAQGTNQDAAQSAEFFPAPETLPMSHFSLILSAGEVLLAGARSRMLFRPGDLNPNAMPEWLACFSMSPVTAKDLHKVLGRLLTDYESQFGQIPDIPAQETTSQR